MKGIEAVVYLNLSVILVQIFISGVMLEVPSLSHTCVPKFAIRNPCSLALKQSEFKDVSIGAKMAQSVNARPWCNKS